MAEDGPDVPQICFMVMPFGKKRVGEPRAQVPRLNSTASHYGTWRFGRPLSMHSYDISSAKVHLNRESSWRADATENGQIYS